MGKLIDLTGKRFGRLVVIRRSADYVEPNGNKVTMWECQCDCGKMTTARSRHLMDGKKKFCGDYCDLKHENLIGKRFGKLLVTDRVSAGKWKCLCDCGNERVIVANQLITGNNTSCGKCEKTINMIGQRFNMLTVIGKAADREHKNSKPTKMWKCRCDCGSIIICSRQALTSGEKKDCGCVKEGKYLVGKRYGKLVIKSVIREKGKESRVECLCDCGNITTPYISRVINNKVYSCGCYRSEKSKEIRIKHGKSYTKIYSVWLGMKKRCYNKNSENYKNYGGRGIRVCKEWLGEHGFENFYDWAKESGYREDLTIDRIDVNGNYEPDNCRWATLEEQAMNKRKTVKILIDGKEITAVELSKKYGIPAATIRYRINSGITDNEKICYKGNLKQLK